MRSRILLLFVVAIGGNDLAWGQSPNSQYLDKDATTWLRDLESKDARKRRNAAFALGKMRTQPWVADKLLPLLKDPDPSVREAATLAVGSMGALRAHEIVPPLIERLQTDEAPEVRRGAAVALGTLGITASPAGEALKRALQHSDARVRQNAAWALGRVGVAATEPALHDLISLLSDKDALVRRDTALTIGTLGPLAKPAVHDLAKTALDQDMAVRLNAIIALGQIGPAAEPAAPAILTLLNDPQSTEDLKEQCILAVSKMGNATIQRALPALRVALKSPNALLREVVSGAYANLGKAGLGEAGKDALLELAALLGDESIAIRRNAALAIHHIVPHNDQDRPAVMKLILEALPKESDKETRLFLTWSFLNLRRRHLANDFWEQAKPVLAKVALEDPWPNIQSEMARVCAQIYGPDAKDVAPVLIKALKDTYNLTNPSTTADTGGSETSRGKTEIDPNLGEDGRFVLAVALGQIGKAAGPEAKRALEEASKDKSPKLRQAAKEALANY
jgi:HEAT repeat protein